MNLLKRVEIWFLLAVIIAGLAWVFTSGSKDDLEDSPMDSGADASESTSGPLKLHRSVLKRDYGNARLDIDLRVRNDKPDRLIMNAPQVKLLNAKGKEVPSFFLPFENLPEVPAKSTQDVQLRYWLEAGDLEGSLKLEVDGQTLEIKNDKPLKLDSLKNSEEQVYKSTDW